MQIKQEREWKGKSYIYGRMERRSEWARSWVRLFEKTGKDDWTLVPDSMIYQLEDPYVALDVKIIGSRPCYPKGPAKKPDLVDCAFTSGKIISGLRSCSPAFSDAGLLMPACRRLHPPP